VVGLVKDNKAKAAGAKPLEPALLLYGLHRANNQASHE
jgi:hypothetical protein